MIEYQFSLKHWLGLGFITIAIVIASIRPLEFEAYILHQLGLDQKKMEVQSLGRTMRLVEEGAPIREIIAG